MVKQRLSLRILIFSILTFIFTIYSCKKEEGYASIKIKGHIADTQGNSIDSLLVTITNIEKKHSDAFRSPANSGNFERIYTLDTARAYTYTIEVDDIDGEKHGGAFISETKTLKITESDYKKSETQLIIHRIAEKEVNFMLEKTQL